MGLAGLERAAFWVKRLFSAFQGKFRRRKILQQVLLHCARVGGRGPGLSLLANFMRCSV